jgi:hypothetical protein
MPRQHPLGENPVGCLRVHIDEAFSLTHRHKVTGGLAQGVLTAGKPDLRPRHKEFPAAAGIFHMHRLHLTVLLHMGDETVGPINKTGNFNVTIPQRFSVLSFQRFVYFLTLYHKGRGIERGSQSFSRKKFRHNVQKGGFTFSYRAKDSGL